MALAPIFPWDEPSPQWGLSTRTCATPIAESSAPAFGVMLSPPTSHPSFGPGFAAHPVLESTESASRRITGRRSYGFKRGKNGVPLPSRPSGGWSCQLGRRRCRPRPPYRTRSALRERARGHPRAVRRLDCLRLLGPGPSVSRSRHRSEFGNSLPNCILFRSARSGRARSPSAWAFPSSEGFHLTVKFERPLPRRCGPDSAGRVWAAWQPQGSPIRESMVRALGDLTSRR